MMPTKKTDEIREQMDKGARVRAQGRKGTLSNRTESKKLSGRRGTPFHEATRMKDLRAQEQQGCKGPRAQKTLRAEGRKGTPFIHLVPKCVRAAQHITFKGGRVCFF